MRMRFWDAPCGTVDGSPVSSEAGFEAKLHGADDAGSPSEQAEAIIAAAREQLEALGFECQLSFSEPLTPIEQFKAASDRKWSFGKRTEDAVDTSQMTPTQRFVAASNKRWGLNQTSTVDTSLMTPTQRFIAVVKARKGR
jgi:hypothetical protein